MMWLVFRSRWAALAWVAMVCVGILVRFEVAGPAMMGGGMTAMAASGEAAAEDRAAARHHHRDRADEPSDSANDDAANDDSRRPDPYSGREPDEYRTRDNRW